MLGDSRQTIGEIKCVTDMLAIVCSVANCLKAFGVFFTHLEWGNSMGAVLNMDCGVGVMG